MHSINWLNQNHLGAPRGLYCVEGGEELHVCLFKKVPLSNTFFIIRLRNSHNDECHKLMKSEILGYKCRGGGTRGGGHWPRKGVWDVRPWRPPFHATPVVRKGPISSKTVNSQDPIMRKFGNFGLYSLNFCQNFSSKAPNLEIFSSQAPKFGNF